ncbi:unnamed protein product [Blumeria hordei]|uniref:G-patch domain-containing protein n=1 Tax=Blumeria hordei TaxID=2867405 RepID=A0A383UXL8_BLUHO|nr:unnamed protein product [Blumeria hordei]
MSHKRSRGKYEADLQTQHSPFTIYGTPLPPRDGDVRDSGLFVPVWKQEVRDERGLKRLHGAFTGGFSAGYFNTVGSKEGWTPSTFISTRSNRKKDASNSDFQRPEDFMDEEDIRDAEDSRRIETAVGFSGFASTIDGTRKKDAFLDLIRVAGETIGVKLLKKMGWKEGQGIGPRVRRMARLDDHNSGEENSGAMHLFAPENTPLIKLVKKKDQLGLGFSKDLSIQNSKSSQSPTALSDDENVSMSFHESNIVKKQPANKGFGVGILNDTGSDDEDPYEVGPQISYSRIIRGEKKTKKKSQKFACTPRLVSKPVYIPKKANLVKGSTVQKCQDGRLPLEGFIIGSGNDTSSLVSFPSKYKLPEVPKDWKPKLSMEKFADVKYLTTADAAKLSKLNHKSRASILGEAELPGKSVFDFLSPAARDRVAAASGKDNLPKALGEIPKEYSMSIEERQKELLSQVPKLDKPTSDAALSRGANGFMPYGGDEEKRSRYRLYLEYQSGLNKSLPCKIPGMSSEDWLKELREFSNCAQIFKPISTTMASRFVSSATVPQANSGSDAPLCRERSKPDDPSEQAAKLSMYGPLTRSSKEWSPTRLLCKRFNVNPPAHVQPCDTEIAGKNTSQLSGPELIPQTTLKSTASTSCLYENHSTSETLVEVESFKSTSRDEKIIVDAGKNDALEARRAGEEVFKAIFGDTSDEDN